MSESLDENTDDENNPSRQRKARRPQTHQSLAELWDDVVAVRGPVHSHYEIGIIGPLAIEINQLLAWDVQEDDVIGIQGDDVRHIIKRHGQPYTDKRGRIFGEFRPDHIPISKEDFQQLPEIFASPILEIDNDQKWGKVLILKKVVLGKKLLAVTIHTSSKKMLHVISMRKTQ
jgi:hypothetical protein